MSDYTVTLQDLSIITGDFEFDRLKGILTDLFLEQGTKIKQIVLRHNNFQVIGDRYEDYKFDFRIYVVGSDRSLKIARFEQDLRLFIFNLSTFGLWY